MQADGKKMEFLMVPTSPAGIHHYINQEMPDAVVDVPQGTTYKLN